jgi:protein ImuA
MLAPSSQREIVDALRQRLQEERLAKHEEFPSGLAGELPATFRRGTLVEYLADGGSGATALALIAAREACREGGALVVVDRSRTFYPPAAAPFGLNQDAILLRPQTQKDELWALNQTLRCPGVGAVVCWPSQLEERAFRGLQIAAEHGGTVGLFIRPTNVRGRPAWSDTQLIVETLPGEKSRQLRIEVIRSRSGCEGVCEILELDDETPALTASRSLSLAAELAAATGATGASRA